MTEPTQCTSKKLLGEWIEDFLQARRIDLGAADTTLQAYRSDLKQWIQWLPSETAEPVETHDIQAFFIHLHERGLKPASLARKMSTLREFFKFCCVEKNFTENPMEKIESPTPEQRLPRFLSETEINALLTTVAQGLSYPTSLGNALRARDQAMVYLLYATGLRVSELMSLTPHQIDISMSYVRVQGKGGKERIAPFAPVAGEKVQTYLENYRNQLNPATDLLFLNHRGLGLTRQAFWRILKLLALQAEIKTPLSPHVIRHSFATHLLQSGMNLRSLQMLLGHSDLTTTQNYTHITPDHLKAAHRKYHPRG